MVFDLRQRRQELGLTLKEVATATKVSEATVSRWESGEIANMKRDKIVALASILEISPAVIMGWQHPEPPQLKNGNGEKEQEKKLLEIFRSMSSSAQQELLGCLKRKNLDINEMFEQRSLTKEERKYLDMYRALPREEQNYIKRNIRLIYDDLELMAKEKGIG